jgi:ribosomal protein L5
MNFFFNDYLVKCDLIYKYNLENINQTPKIEKVTVSLKMNENFN